MERAEVQFGRTVIAFGIRRTGRQKTVSIAIDPELGVVVTAPRQTETERLQKIVHRKARWVVERLKQVQRVEPRLPKREFVSGETFLYLGRQYRLRLETGKKGPARLERGRFVVPVAAKHGPEQAREALVAWYQEHARRRLTERLPGWAKKVGVDVPSLLVREQQQRWASCDARGVLRFNWRIVQAPMRLVEYVIAHELVHMRHANHTRAFWAALGKVMPDYEERRERLREVGPRLGW